MTETIERSNRTARKTYRCDYCGEKIEKGETYDYYKGKYDCKVIGFDACDKYTMNVWLDYEDYMPKLIRRNA